MQEPHVTDLIPAYTLGALEPDQVDAIERHLAHCESCSAEARLNARVGDELLLAAPPRSAPAQVRERLLAHVRALQADATEAAEATEQEVTPAPPLGTPHGAPRSSNPIVRAWRAAFGDAGADQETDQTLRDLMLDPQSVVFPVAGTPDAPDASARLIASPRRDAAVLLASGLHAPGAGRAYQVWLLRNGQPVPNTLFNIDRRGRGLSIVRVSGPLRDYDTVAVTPEPASGSPGPTGPIVLAGALTR